MIASIGPIIDSALAWDYARLNRGSLSAEDCQTLADNWNTMMFVLRGLKLILAGEAPILVDDVLDALIDKCEQAKLDFRAHARHG